MVLYIEIRARVFDLGYITNFPSILFTSAPLTFTSTNQYEVSCDGYIIKTYRNVTLYIYEK